MKIASSSERLKELLRIHNETQADMVRKTGIEKSAISNYINGRREARQDKLIIIANAYNVNPAWLMGLDVPMNAYKLDYLTNDDLEISFPEQKFDFNRLEAILNEYKKTKDKKALKAYANSDLSKAIELFGLYENSSPEVRSAVELLLKSAQQKP